MQKHTQKQVIESIEDIHGTDKFSFDKMKYIKTDGYIVVTCKIHGDFETTAKGLLRGHGCRKCGKTEKLTTEVFIKRSISVHGETYNYNKTDYSGIMKPITITCQKHGDFVTVANNHLNCGHGCPQCSLSKGEARIKWFFDRYKVQYEQQKKFEGCVSDKNYPLKFDFYLPKQNLCVEFQGQQHFVEIKHLGGKEGLQRYKVYDQIKQDFCAQHNIKLICIPYWELNKVSQILNKEL